MKALTSCMPVLALALAIPLATQAAGSVPNAPACLEKPLRFLPGSLGGKYQAVTLAMSSRGWDSALRI